MTDLDGVDRLLLDEADADDLLVLDAPALARHLHQQGRNVRAWCDDWGEHQQLPAELRQPEVGFPQADGCQVALYRIPKTLSELDELAGIAALGGARLLAGAKLRHLVKSMNSVISRHYGELSASRGAYKARVLRGFKPSRRPSEWPKQRRHDDLDIWLAAHGGTFAGNKVDLGTRLLVQHLRKVRGERVIDLGSGNGTLSALLAKSGRQVHATDASIAAVAATRETARLNDLDITVTWANGLSAVADGAADAIVTNPPFHQGRAKESSPTLEMFADAARVLTPGGEFWCVFNSHLPWRRELSRLVGETTVVDQNPHYTVTKSIAG